MNMTIQNRLSQLHSQRMLPQDHVRFLHELAAQGVQPAVIYDIGACVLHWYQEAVQVWPQAEFHVLDAQPSVKFLYESSGLKHHVAVLSDSDRRTVTFWQNDWHPGGNSYYPENTKINPESQTSSPEHRTVRTCETLDSIIHKQSWRLPDLVKMDVQGSELDILKGMVHSLPHVQHLILELQTTDYNMGAPKADEVISWLKDQGFDCVAPLFCDSGVDGDYYFRRT